MLLKNGLNPAVFVDCAVRMVATFLAYFVVNNEGMEDLPMPGTKIQKVNLKRKKSENKNLREF